MTPPAAQALKVFGVGVDIAHIPRFQKTFARHGERFLRRAFHPTEIAEFYNKSDAARAGFLASRHAPICFYGNELFHLFYHLTLAAFPLALLYRWAVKEATYKAFQRYRVLFPEIRLVKQGGAAGAASSTAPTDLFAPLQTKLAVAEASQALRLEFYGETLALAEQLHLAEPHVSISHDEDYAIAYVVLQQKVSAD